MLTLSLIIPVYNEERHITACLDAIARQTRMPDEVIVVDNNCNDKTVLLAKKYAFVRVVKEPLQGRAHARSAGFNAAKGDILGRIDADSLLDPLWTEHALAQFESDSELAGLTGLGTASFLPVMRWPKNSLFSRSYFWFVHAQFNTVTMWGANMAIRSSWWKKVKTSVCEDDSLVHEDQDLSLCMAAKGAKIQMSDTMHITTETQSFRYLPKLLHYSQLFKDTRQRHIDSGSFSSPHMPLLGFRQTLTGRILAVLVAMYMGTVSLLIFPIDYTVNKVWPNSAWLD